MRICLYSNAFFPRLGGIQSVSESLAYEWHKGGHDVLVVTDTAADDGYDQKYPFKTLRLPKWRDWRRIGREYDVIVSNGFSIRHLPAWLLTRARFFWIHATHVAWTNPTGVSPWVWLKWKLRRKLRPPISWLATGGNIFISEAVKEDLGAANGTVIFNPIGGLFRPMPDVPQIADFGFFGRMWLAKGQDTLLHALQKCHQQGHRYTVAFWGDGEHVPQIKQLVEELKLTDSVRLIPAVSGDELVKAMNSVGVVVVPSRLAEPMGMVAVEAMACRKCVIGTNQGGLGEVLNGWMPTFDNGDVEQLKNLMIELQTHPELRQQYESRALERAAEFAGPIIANKYVQLFASRGRAKAAVSPAGSS